MATAMLCAVFMAPNGRHAACSTPVRTALRQLPLKCAATASARALQRSGSGDRCTFFGVIPWASARNPQVTPVLRNADLKPFRSQPPCAWSRNPGERRTDVTPVQPASRPHGPNASSSGYDSPRESQGVDRWRCENASATSSQLLRPFLPGVPRPAPSPRSRRNTLAVSCSEYCRSRLVQELIQPLARGGGHGPVRRRERIGGMLNYHLRSHNGAGRSRREPPVHAAYSLAS